MEGSRRLIGWLTRESQERSHGVQVFAGPGGGLADHLEEALQRPRSADGYVLVIPDLVRETVEFLRALAAETPAPYVVSFVNFHGWRAEMRLAIQDGRLVVSGLRLTPAADEVLPRGGITARLLREVPLHKHVQVLAADMPHQPHRREVLETLLIGTGLEGMLDTLSGPPPAAPRPQGRGRRPIAMETLLEVAETYDSMEATSKQPVRDAAKWLRTKHPNASPSWSDIRVRDLVHRARQGGFLTPAAWGIPGGRLTPRAKALLKEQRRKASRQRRPRQ